MPQAGDEIDWKDQLSTLPTPIRAAIVWIRLSGMIAVILALVGVMIGRDLGMFEDTASRDRRELLKLGVDQQRLLSENQVILRQQLEITQRHTANTEAISRNLCMMIPTLTERERRACVNNEKW